MEVTYNQHIGIYENAISQEFCDKVIDFFEKNESVKRTAKENSSSIKKEDSILETPVPSEITGEFFQTFHKNIFYPYNIKYAPLKENQPFNFIDFKVQKTLPSEGYHDWHYESSGYQVLERLAVWTLYLNDVEYGGETEFLHQSLRVKPKKGTVCVFPAGYTHYHRGNPPLSGVKYIATGWVHWMKSEKNKSI